MDSIPLLTQPARLWRDKTDFFKPFRNAAKTSTAGENITPLFDPDLAHTTHEHETEVAELNHALQTLVEVFPDVEVEVFREMLTSISNESRIAVVAEQVLKRNVKGRKRRSLGGHDRQVRIRGPLLLEDTFRGKTYHDAVKSLLYQEFKGLNHSTVKGVMAENNSSYTKSRPVLQILASRTWRASLVSLWRRKDTSEDMAHPAVLRDVKRAGPTIRSTGSPQLDRELYGLFVRPWTEAQRSQQLASDQLLALELNEADAIEAEATYECECCYSTVAFEQIATCETGDHFLCLDCIKRTTTEALYGQGWARSADLDKSTIRCFAPALQECRNALPGEYVERALQQDLDSKDVWTEFRRRVTIEVLLKSRLVLQRCPFCTYAEIDETPRALLRQPGQLQMYLAGQFARSLPARAAATLATAAMPVVAALLVCLGLVVAVLSYFSSVVLLIRPSSSPPLVVGSVTLTAPLAAPASASLNRINKHRRGLKFKCLDRSCLRASCTRCLAAWQDPHICFDNEKTSLRTAIEASATAAIKRTCPRCFLSFVKASGCNKLVCNCGYTMCYVCRSEITAKEGYTHFCQHFRPSGGRCSECDRCDLYGDEDEEIAIRKATQIAKREWKEKMALKQRADGVHEDDQSSKVMVEAVVGHGIERRWFEQWLDAVLDVAVVFADD